MDIYSTTMLSSYLVRDKLYPTESKVGSSKGNAKRCEMCKSVLQTDIFNCSNDKTTLQNKS